MKHVWVVALLIIPACGGGGGGAGGAGGSMGGCVGVYPASYMDVCMPAAPTTEAVRTLCSNPYGIREYCATDTNTMPQLGCLPNKADSSAPATPAVATITGFAKVFSAGPSSDMIKIEVFRQSDLQDANSLASASPLGSTIVQADVSTARACPQPEQGTAPPPCSVPATCTPACGASDYCDGTSGAPTCIARKRYEYRYSIGNIPTNTPLAIRTSGPGGDNDATWAPMVQFRFIVPTNDPMCAAGDTNADLCWKDAGKTQYEASVAVLSRADYNNIPTSVGLSAGITAGHGAVAGEVRDCTNVRIEHATVGYSPTPDKYAYFNSIPFMTLPANGKLDTDALGLFSGMNLPAGKVRVRAQGKVGGNLVDLGGADAIIFPNTVSIVGINSGRPIDQP